MKDDPKMKNTSTGNIVWIQVQPVEAHETKSDGLKFQFKPTSKAELL
jgi:hypothetical protein